MTLNEADILFEYHGMALTRYFSIMNPWIDFVVITPAKDKEDAEELIDLAMDDFWEEDCEYECYGDIVCNYLKNHDIPFVIIYHDSEREDSEYEDVWDALLDKMMPRRRRRINNEYNP